ncbi:MAG: hypothetical protein MUC96_08770 [Myxococcaceae bacterium]|jgi:hypothetical protein|nr:hypothetical protein [Myxococcaceae bacterium]
MFDGSMRWVSALVVFVSAVIAGVAGFFMLMVLMNGAGERAASSALRFFSVAMVVAGVATAAVAGTVTGVQARAGRSRFLQALWGVGTGWVCLAGLTFVLALVSLGLAS